MEGPAMIASANANVYSNQESRWMTTSEVPLRPDLRWAIEARLQTVSANMPQMRVLAWIMSGVFALVLAAFAAVAVLLSPFLSPNSQTQSWLILGGIGAFGMVSTIVMFNWIREQQWKQRSLERDLLDGVHTEIVTDVEYHPAISYKHSDELIIGGRVLLDQHRYDRAAIAKLRGLSPLRNAIVCYSPNAQMLLEIVTADGVLVYRPPELMGQATH
jgi:hypothetical protein